MTIQELGKKLSDMYNSAPDGRQVTFIHLFGIRYANEINRLGRTAIKDIVKASTVKESFVTEVNKGVNLSEFVSEK